MAARPLNDISIIEDVLRQRGRVAVVGLSPKAERDSNEVADYMISKGFDVVPVNPMVSEVFGRKSYASVKDIPGEIDVVDVFRKPEEIGPIVDEAIEKGVKVLWLQKTVVNTVEAEKARAAGIDVVMDRCILAEGKKRGI